MSLSKKSIFLFETIRLIDGEPQNLEFHIKRAQNSISKSLKFDFREILKCKMQGLVRAKVVYSDYGKLESVNFYPYERRKFYKFHFVNINFNYDKKFLDRSDIDKAKGEFDEIVMIKNGLATDTSIANIAIFDGKEWITPKSPLLKGTFRESLLKNGSLKTKDIGVDELIKSKKFAVMNAMMGFYEIEKFEFIVS